MSKYVCVALPYIWRRNTSPSSRLGLPSCKCFSSTVSKKSKSTKNSINLPKVQKDIQQLSSKKQSKIFVVFTILWSRLVNPFIYFFTPGIKAVDQLAKLNDFRTFNAFGLKEENAVHKAAVTHSKCIENPKPINVKKKLEVDDSAIKDPYKVVHSGIKSKIFWGNKIKYSNTPKIERLPKVGYSSMLYNITLKKVVDAKIERMMPNINQGQLSYFCDPRAYKLDEDIAYMQEKTEPFVHEVKNCLKKSLSELNEVAVEVGKDKCQGSMNLTASLDIIGAEPKIAEENGSKKQEGNKNNNLKIKIVTLKPPHYIKASQNIIKHSLNIKSPMTTNVKKAPINIKDDTVKRLNKINNTSLEQMKLDNQVRTSVDGKLKEKLIPNIKLNVAERNQLSTNNEAFKKTEIGGKDLKATTLNRESIIENKKNNFVPESNTQIAKESTKLANDTCLAVAFNDSCDTKLKVERNSLNQPNERLLSFESMQQLSTEEDNNDDMDKMKGKTVDSQTSVNINEVKQQTNEASSDDEINLDCKNREGNSLKEIINTEDGAHTTSGEESDGSVTEQENVNSLNCQSAEDEESEEYVSSSINKVLVEKAPPETPQNLSTELISFNTAGEEGIFKIQKQNVGSDDKGKLVDMNTVLVKESREIKRKTNDGHFKSIGNKKLKNSLTNLSNSETVKSKNTSDLDKSTVKPWKRMKETEYNVNSVREQIKSDDDGVNSRYITNKSEGESIVKSTGPKLHSTKSALKNTNKIKVPKKTLSLEGVESKIKRKNKINANTISPVPDLLNLEINKSIADKKTQVNLNKAQSMTTVKEHKDNKNIKVKLKEQSKRAAEPKIKLTQDISMKKENQSLKINKNKNDISQQIVETSVIKDNKNNEKMTISKLKTEHIVVKKPLEKHVEENNGMQPKIKLQKNNSFKKTTKSLIGLGKSAMSINSPKSMKEPNNVIKDDVLGRQEQNSDKLTIKNKINKEISKSKSATNWSNNSKSTGVSSNNEGEKNTASNLKPNREIKKEIRDSTDRLLLKKTNSKHEKINREISRVTSQNRANKANKLIKESELKSVTNKPLQNTSKDNEGEKEKSLLENRLNENVPTNIGKDNKLHQNLDINTRNSLSSKVSQPKNTTNQKKKVNENIKEYQKPIKSRNVAMISPIYKNTDKNNSDSLNQNDNERKINPVLNSQKIAESEIKQANKSKRSFMLNNKHNSLNTLMRRNIPEQLEDS